MPQGKRIWLIRHGESVANAGFASRNVADIPLTDKGKEQAARGAMVLRATPDILTSPFRRAIETTECILKRRRNANVEIIEDLREFTYLAPSTCVNTTKEERKSKVDIYWQKIDPYYVDGEGAESFGKLMKRANKVLFYILSRNSNRFIAVVSHEQFLKAFLLCCYDSSLTLEEKMAKFITMDTIENAAVMEVRFFEGQFCKL